MSVRIALTFAPPAILGALLGAELGLRATAELQLTVFKLVMIGAAVWMYAGQGALVANRRARDPEAHRAGIPLGVLALVGGLVGTLTGFVGVGGGFLYVPTLVLLAGLEMRLAVGTSLVLIMVSCIAGVVRYHGSLTLDWGAIALFTAVALVGVYLGSRLVPRVPQATLRKGFALFLLLMGAFVLLYGR